MGWFSASILSYLLQNFSNKQFSLSIKKTSAGTTLIQNGLCVCSAALFLMIVSGLKPLPFSVIGLAVLFGILYLLTVFLLLKAFSLGSMGASTLLCNIGNFISTFYGILRFHDAFTLYIAIGTVFLLCAVLLSTPRDRTAQRGGMRWFVTALASGLCNGAVASVKREAVALYAGDIQSFLMWGFFFATLTAIVIFCSQKRNRTDWHVVAQQPKLLLFGLLAGLGTAAANFCQMQAIRYVSSAIIYPLTSGFLVVALGVASVVIYKEARFTRGNLIAILCCVIAIVLVNL